MKAARRSDASWKCCLYRTAIQVVDQWPKASSIILPTSITRSHLLASFGVLQVRVWRSLIKAICRNSCVFESSPKIILIRCTVVDKWVVLFSYNLEFALAAELQFIDICFVASTVRLQQIWLHALYGAVAVSWDLFPFARLIINRGMYALDLKASLIWLRLIRKLASICSATSWRAETKSFVIRLMWVDQTRETNRFDITFSHFDLQEDLNTFRICFERIYIACEDFYFHINERRLCWPWTSPLSFFLAFCRRNENE